MMERRTFLVLASGSFLTAPFVVAAQPVGQVYRIGLLRAGQPPKTWIESFQQGLRASASNTPWQIARPSFQPW